MSKSTDINNKLETNDSGHITYNDNEHTWDMTKIKNNFNTYNNN